MDRIERALNALEEYREELLKNEDVVDGAEGQPRPNWAMEARMLLDSILAKHLKKKTI